VVVATALKQIAAAAGDNELASSLQAVANNLT